MPRQGLLTSLFSFNAGVEIGQIVIIALLLCLRLMRENPGEEIVQINHPRRWEPNPSGVAVSGKPSPLFWFTASEVLAKNQKIGRRFIPRFILEPDLIFRRVWFNPVDEQPLSLLDP
ncbi:HupE/UreJ family protein [Acidobacteria bacterium AH-259-O06]|nr:HupE/UreJ family protein [Acidobacteria bacterium AH-259-O06]